MPHDVGAEVAQRELSRPQLGIPREIPAEDCSALASVPADALSEGLRLHVLPGGDTAMPSRVIPPRDVGLNGAADERALRYGGVLANPNVQYDCRRFGSARGNRFDGGEPDAYEDYSEAYSQERLLQQQRRQGASEGGGRRSRRREGRRQEETR